MSPVIIGVLWMFLATLSFVAMSVSIRALAGEIGAVEILFFRSAIGVVIFLPWIARNGVRVLHTRMFGIHVIRSALLGLGMVFWFFAIARLPLGDAIALHFTLPLFLIVFAAIFLREKVDGSVWIATVAGFSGVLLILKPGFQDINIAMIYVLVSGALYGGNHVFTKILSRTESGSATAFYMNLLILPGSAAALPFFWTVPQWHHYGWLLVIGLAGSSAHVCLMRAFRHADANVLAPIDFLRLVFAAIAGYILFGDVSGIMTWVGAGVIFVAATYSTRRAQQLHREGQRGPDP